MAKKQSAIDARIATLTGQRDELQGKLDAFKKPLVSATMNGDAKKLNEIRTSMKQLEADRQQVLVEIDMLEGTHITGDEALYNAVHEKAEAHSKAIQAYQDAKKQIFNLASKHEEAYHHLQNETKHWNLGGGHPVNLTEINEHYHREGYAKINTQAAQDQADADAEDEKRRNTFIYDGTRRATQIIGE